MNLRDNPGARGPSHRRRLRGAWAIRQDFLCSRARIGCWPGSRRSSARSAERNATI